MKRRTFLVFLGACVALVSGCATQTKSTVPPAPLILISLDAFRWDYVAKYPAEMPNFQRLIREGVTAEGLIPMFPSNTFVNHYSIVTGLYPARHGIINNEMFDATTGMFFRYNQLASAGQSQWWNGEPIWSTAIKQGGLGGCWFWPGSEAEIGGLRPSAWQKYDNKLIFDTRLDSLMAWLEQNRGKSPIVATMYLEETNSIGHKFGPDSPELAAALNVADNRIGQLQARLQAAGLTANLVLVSDHGMTPISPERVIFLDNFITPADVQVDFDGPAVGLRPRQGDVDSLMRALAGVKNARVYRAEDLPARYHMRDNPRIPPVWIVPDEGWEVYFRTRFEGYRTAGFNKADHGYDPIYTSMRGIFIANGPAFRRGVKVPATENIHVYNLLCAALRLKPAPNDGDDRLVREALAR